MSFSRLLILISTITTILSMVFPNILIYGMNPYFLMDRDWIGLGIQFLLYQFLHGGVLHLVSNSFFLFLFGDTIEERMGHGRFVTFFLINTVFVGISLLFFANGNTIGISGFAMAILAYIFMMLRAERNPEWRSAGLFLFINVAIGFTGNISLVGHLSGAICGILIYQIWWAKRFD